jgi:hypothetical protein
MTMSLWTHLGLAAALHLSPAPVPPPSEPVPAAIVPAPVTVPTTPVSVTVPVTVPTMPVTTGKANVYQPPDTTTPTTWYIPPVSTQIECVVTLSGPYPILFSPADADVNGSCAAVAAEYPGDSVVPQSVTTYYTAP